MLSRQAVKIHCELGAAEDVVSPSALQMFNGSLFRGGRGNIQYTQFPIHEKRLPV